MNDFNIINNIYEAIYEVNKSKFIAYLHPLNSEDEVKTILAKIKKEHFKANHHCYAYLFDKTFKINDDKEPSGTAGMPMLEILKKYNLNNTLVVVVRYFGGILLGKGGLVRAYSGASETVIKKAELIKVGYRKAYLVKIDYSFYDEFNYYLTSNQISITNKDFQEKVEINLVLPNSISINEIGQRFYNKLEIIDLGMILAPEKMS